MKISDSSIERPVTVIMLICIVLLIGFVSVSKLSVDLYPNFEIPVAIVSTTYQGAAPSETEELISKPIEETMATLTGVKSIRSISNEGSSLVILEFEYGIDIDSATLEMRDRLDYVSAFLPEDAEDSLIYKIDLNSIPIMIYSVTSDKGLEYAQNIVENKFVSRIERISGVAAVESNGGYENEVSIITDPGKLLKYNITQDEIVNYLRVENLNSPGGKIIKGEKELTVRTLGEFKSVDEIKSLEIPLKTGRRIFLRDLAEVKFQPKELTSFNRIDGEESISINVKKQSNSNTVNVASKVKEEMESLRKEFGEDVKVTLVFDQAKFINQSIKNVSQNGIVGGILAIVILFLFLRNVRTTFIIGVSIPISIITTFILMYFNNLTLNMMTLGGLALGMGMLVDNSIVVLENIFRMRTMGHSKFEAARLGASEVGMAIIASTLTTIAVFLPIAFMEGITSMIFKELALTVSFSLIASLVVALTVVPMMASQLINVKVNDGEKINLSKFEKYFEKTKDRYKKILKSALNHKIRTVIIAIVIFVVSVVSTASLGGVFLPEVDEGAVNVQIELPVGYSLESTENILAEFISSIEDIEDIDYVFESLGGADVISFGNRGDSSNTATLYILLKEKSDRDHTAQEVADEIRSRTENIPGANIVVSATESSGFGGSTSPIEISVRGDEIDELNRISKEILEIVKGVKGTREATTTYEDGKEELRVVIDREMASKYGLNAYTIGKTVRESINGVIATKYKVDGSEYDVSVKSQKYLRENLSNFKNILISTPMGVKIPVEYVADIYVDKGPIFIERIDQVRTIRVTSAIFGRDLRSISQDIEKGIKNVYFPTGYSYKIGGMNEELNSAFKNLGIAIILAIVLVYMVMASQFESFAHPFIIMFAVPLAIAGGGLGLFITRNPVSVPALIGGIMLTGIVVNNGIVLIDYTNHLKKNEDISYYDALLIAGPTRLRPILMTTLTTVLGLLPLALGIGEGSEAIAPLAIVVVFGLMIATLLTLVFVPVLLLIFVNIKEKFSRKFLKGKDLMNE